MDPLIKIGERTPTFQLPDLEGEFYGLQEFLGKILVINFWSAECEWCKRVDREIVFYQDLWREQARVVWIASNNNKTPDLIKNTAAERHLRVVLVDEQHQVADKYGAQTTPHFFVLDEQGIARYQGAWDDITFRHRMPTVEYVPRAVEALRQGRAPEITQTQPYGCAMVRF
jgi:peroxiredoxin